MTKVKEEVTVCSDGPSIPYQHISDAFVITEGFFLHFTNDSTLGIDLYPVSYPDTN